MAYQEIDENKRTLRTSLDYGVRLGFLQVDGNYYELTSRGSGLGWSPNLEDDAVVDAFREAIEQFKPYRNAFLKVHVDDGLSEVSGESCITQGALKEALEEFLGENVHNREVNLLIKTADAAGLGDYVTGRRGLETRLKVLEGYKEYINQLSKSYSIPEKTKETDSSAEPQSKEVEEDDSASDKASGGVKLTIEIDVEDKDEEEVASLVKKVKEIT